MEQTIAIGWGGSFLIVIGVVGSISAITFSLLSYFDKKNERRIHEMRAGFVGHRQESKTACKR